MGDEEEIVVEVEKEEIEIKEGRKDDDEVIEDDDEKHVEERKEDNEKKIKEEKKDKKEDEVDGETLDYWKAKGQSSWTLERELADAIMDSLRRNGSDDVFKLDK